MNLSEYQKLCKKTAKSDFESPDLEILTWGLGIVGEAGDAASCIKKVVAHKNEALKDGLRENLGDTMWYIATICNFYGWNLEEVLNENIEKLKKRYGDEGFTNEKAQRKGTKEDWGEK